MTSSSPFQRIKRSYSTAFTCCRGKGILAAVLDGSFMARKRRTVSLAHVASSYCSSSGRNRRWCRWRRDLLVINKFQDVHLKTRLISVDEIWKCVCVFFWEESLILSVRGFLPLLLQQLPFKKSPTVFLTQGLVWSYKYTHSSDLKFSNPINVPKNDDAGQPVARGSQNTHFMQKECSAAFELSSSASPSTLITPFNIHSTTRFPFRLRSYLRIPATRLIFASSWVIRNVLLCVSTSACVLCVPVGWFRLLSVRV